MNELRGKYTDCIKMVQNLHKKGMLCGPLPQPETVYGTEYEGHKDPLDAEVQTRSLDGTINPAQYQHAPRQNQILRRSSSS